MESHKLYEEIAKRTDGDIYIGVVGPVRTGKSTFIKRFMETLVIPNIENVYRRERAKDELPQSGSGRTIMTAEPKFVPEEAVEIALPEGGSFSVRLIDCVGYMVKGAIGHLEGEEPRMVTTPWFDEEIPMTEAAEIGTKKVVEEHSTIGIVVTTDGSITDLEREEYLEAEARVIRELKEIGKPFLVLLNSAHPQARETQELRDELSKKHGVTCLAVNCMDLDETDVTKIIQGVLYEFPLVELRAFLPSWVDALPQSHPIKSGLYDKLRQAGEKLVRIRDVFAAAEALSRQENIQQTLIRGMDLGSGVADLEIRLPQDLFYETLSQQSGFEIRNEGDLLSLLSGLARMKSEYDKVANALAEVRSTGYGIVTPDLQELVLEEPEIVRQGGRYGVRMKASAPSIHMLRADIQTEVAPMVGSEQQSEELVNYLLSEFEGDTGKIWQTNIFGKSFHELVNEDLQTKLKRMPEDAREKLRHTLERIINEGSSGLICIIL